MRAGRICLMLTIGSLPLSARVLAQSVTVADRTVSVMAGAYTARDNTPAFSSRLRLQTAPWGAAEFELGVARGTERACALVLDGLDPCSRRHFPVFLGFLTYGVSLPNASGRPYVQAGAGALASTDADFLLLGVVSAGLSVPVLDGWGLRFEIGRRFDSEDGATHVLGGLEFAWH